MENKTKKLTLKKAVHKNSVSGLSELLTDFARSLNYNGVKIFTDYGAKKAVREFLAVKRAKKHLW